MRRFIILQKVVPSPYLRFSYVPTLELLAQVVFLLGLQRGQTDR